MDKEARKQKVEEIREKMGAPRSRALESNHRTRDTGNKDGGANTPPQPQQSNTATDTNNQPPPSLRVPLGSTKKEEEPEKDPTKKEEV